jgi:hypothetical protein
MYLPELSIILFSIDKEKFVQIDSLISVGDLPKELQGLYRTIKSHHEHSEDSLSLDDLANIWFAQRPKDPEYYRSLFANLKSLSVKEETVFTLCKSLKRAKLLQALSIEAYNASEGNSEAFEKVKEQLRQLEESTEDSQTKDEFEYVVDDLDQLLAQTYSKPGLQWRLPSLNRYLGSLRQGDLGFVFARPETGKTTFIASECSHMAEQGDRPILHLNNEEVHEKVKLRYYQATLSATLQQLLGNRERADRAFKDRIQGRILIPKLGQFSAKEVERLCHLHNPKLIIFDQLDKVTGFDDDRDDLKLGKIYQWARELSKEYCPTIGVSQAGATAEGTKWLTMSDVANARTSKQAEADWILGIGKSHGEGLDNIRYLHLCKNKLMGDEGGDPTMRHGRFEVLIDASVARYKDL